MSIEELIAVDGLPAISVAGYSLGGNLALKLAGEYGDAPPPELRTVSAVSPIIEIGECVRALERPGNFLYQWNFVKDLKRRMRRKERCRPGRFDLTKLGRIRTVREFDEAYTAPYFGFKDAEDYYHRASAMRVVDRVRLPALIITAEDDPFVPAQAFREPQVADNPHITVLACRARRPLRVRRPGSRGRTMATGPRTIVISWTLTSRAESIDQHLRELGPLSFLLVLEVHEHVAAGARGAGDRVGPPGDVVGRVAFVAQPEVRVLGGDPNRRRHLLAVGDAQREVARRQTVEDLVVEP